MEVCQELIVLIVEQRWRRHDMKIHDYIKDRDNAMLAYPDTSKLEKLVKKYSGLFSPDWKLRWRKATPLVKVITLEQMILNWTGAPAELVAKVNEAREKRLRS